MLRAVKDIEQLEKQLVVILRGQPAEHSANQERLQIYEDRIDACLARVRTESLSKRPSRNGTSVLVSIAVSRWKNTPRLVSGSHLAEAAVDDSVTLKLTEVGLGGVLWLACGELLELRKEMGKRTPGHA